MKKSYFLTLATIFMAIVTVPTMCMELETPIIINVDLHLKKAERIFKDKDKHDEHACKVLGINWEPNNNPYIVTYAFFKNLDPATQNSSFKRYGIDCWTHTVPTNLPRSTIRNPFIKEVEKHPDLPYQMNKFPSTLPNNFVTKLKELKEEETITLSNTMFEKPVIVNVALKSIIDNATTSSEANPQGALDPRDQTHYQSLAQSQLQTLKHQNSQIKKYLEDNPQITTEKAKEIDQTLDNMEKSIATLEEQTKKNTNPTFTKTKIFGLTIAGSLIAYLIYYLHQNNQLNTEFFNAQLSRISDFIQQLRK